MMPSTAYAPAEKQSAKPDSSTPSRSKRSVFDVQGLCCQNEARLIEETLYAQKGIVNLTINIPSGTLTAIHEEESISVSTIEELLHKLGLRALVRTTRQRSQKFERHSYRQPKFMTMVAGALLVILAVSMQYAMDLASAAPFIYLAAIIIGGAFVFQSAWHSFRRRQLDISVLMTIAVAGAIGLGEWLEASTVIVLFAFAEWLESMSMSRARRAITELMELAPPLALVKVNDQWLEVPVEEVHPGDHVIVRPGAKVPVDGIVIEGVSDINEATITGESIPAIKSAGMDVFAGTINGSGRLEVRVSKSADQSTLAHIIDAIEDARRNQSDAERFVDRFARYYTPLVVVIAALIALIPPLLFGGLWGEWFYRALVLLVIACPCALVISTPIATVAGLARAAREGILVKGGRFLEALARVRAIAFDKTGTLTQGKPEVTDIITTGSYTSAEILYFAALAELYSEHHIGRAIVARAHQENIYPEQSQLESFQAQIGLGVIALMSPSAKNFSNLGETRQFSKLFVGSKRLFDDNNIDYQSLNEQWERLQLSGKTVVAVASDSDVLGLIAVSDTPRIQARYALERLRKEGVFCVMLTGDNPSNAAYIAQQIGLDSKQDQVFASLLPADKVAHVKALTNDYKRVAMVGDGVNDAPALAAASVGIAMGAAGTDVALESADVALMADDLEKLPRTIEIGKQTVRIIKQNIFFALGLKAFFLILAAMGIATLWMAIVADMGASLVVILNGLRLLKKTG